MIFGDMNGNVALLCGGQSRRFGSDKALALLDGKALIDIIAEKFILSGFSVAVVSKDNSKYASVIRGSVTFIEDIFEQQCPMAGLITALEYFGEPFFAVSADAPLVRPEAAELLLEKLVDFQAAVPDINGKIHPMIAAYSPSSVPVFRKYFDEGNYRLTAALSEMKVFYADADLFAKEGISAGIFANVNSRKDLENLKL
jgi:molybdopterin-guanine dinucleotide biosynthesis protein A